MIVEKKGLKLLGMNNKESILMELKTRTEIDDGIGNGSFWFAGGDRDTCISTTLE